MCDFTLQGVIDTSHLRVNHKSGDAELSLVHEATHPLQLVHLDYLMIKVTEGRKDVHVSIITDYFIRYAQALVTSLQTDKCTTEAFWD